MLSQFLNHSFWWLTFNELNRSISYIVHKIFLKCVLRPTLNFHFSMIFYVCHHSHLSVRTDTSLLSLNLFLHPSCSLVSSYSKPSFLVGPFYLFWTCFLMFVPILLGGPGDMRRLGTELSISVPSAVSCFYFVWHDTFTFKSHQFQW